MADTFVSYPITGYVATAYAPRLSVKLRILRVIIVVVLAFLLLYHFANTVLVGTSDLSAKQPRIDDMHAMLKPSEDSALLDANVTMWVTFGKKGSIKLSPDLATFNLSLNVSKHTISAVATSTFKVMEDEQQLVLHFKHETRLTKEEMRVFQKKLQLRSLWMKLNGDFKWHVKNSRWLVFERIYGHTKFSCDINYAHLLKNAKPKAVCDLNQ